MRAAVLTLLVAAPLALGSVHEPAFVPVLVLGSAAGLASWMRGHWRRAHGVEMPPLPGRGLLLALHLLVLLQLVPLPPFVLKLVSPGSFRFYDAPMLVPLTGFRPITVNPADTARGLCFLAGMTLLYGAVFREFHSARARRRLAACVVATALFMTVVALIQAASPEPTRIYGLWKPQWDWAVFGPYVSRNHFAGYVAMAALLAIGFAGDAMTALAADWRARRPRWVALGGPAGNAALRLVAVSMALVVGLVASGSRGGVMAFTLALLAALAVTWRRRSAFLLVFAVVALGVAWVDLAALRHGFVSRGVHQSRIVIWQDALRMFPDFPVFGAGFNAFGTSYAVYQKLLRYAWYGEVHNEYLQVLLDTGIVGAVIAFLLLAQLLRRAAASARLGAMETGVLGALLACCFHNLVDFNWQIAANAATFAALAGSAVAAAPRRAERSLTPAAPAPRIGAGGTPHHRAP